MPSIKLRTSCGSEGGVEEKKEEDETSPTASTVQHRQSYNQAELDDEPYDEQKDGFQARVENLAKTIMGSCGHALSSWLPGESCSRWPGSGGGAGQPPHHAAAAGGDNLIPTSPLPGGGAACGRPPDKPPLSITDELRKLAAKEGRVFGGGMRRADIPRFLGEDAVYSFDDDNISAISQHTLEEMTRHGIKHNRHHRQKQQRRNQEQTEAAAAPSSSSDNDSESPNYSRPPSPTLTQSGSSKSDKETKSSVP